MGVSGDQKLTLPGVLGVTKNGASWVALEQDRLVTRPMAGTLGIDALNAKESGRGSGRMSLSPSGNILVWLDGLRFCVWKADDQPSAKTCGQSEWAFAKTSLSFLPDEERFITMASSKAGLRLIEVDWKTVRARAFQSGELSYGFAVSADGETLAAAGRFGELYLGQTTGQVLTQIGKHPRQITTIDFSGDGNWIATGSLDRSVRLWSTKTFEYLEIGFQNPVENVKFDPQARILYVASGVAVRIFDVSTLSDGRADLSSVRKSHAIAKEH